MKKVKVLQYTGAMNRGGAETLLMNIYRNIDREKFEFHFISHSESKSDYDDEIIKLGGKVIYLEKPSIKQLNKFSRQFNKIVNEFGPYDAIHTHMQLFNGIVLKESAKNGISTRISHAHLNGDYVKNNILRDIYVKYSKVLINKNSTHKLSCSYESGKYLYDSNKFKLINNAIDVNQFKFDKKSDYLNKELNLDNDYKIITHIGTFKEAKNHNFIIDIFKQLKQENNKYKLVLVGRGSLEEAIKIKVNNLKLEDDIYFLGVREDIPQILQSTDVFFMPSILEGLPVVLVEAQAAGVPCVISNNIPKECDMKLNLIKSLDLSEEKDIWVKALINSSSIAKTEFNTRVDNIINNGYDLSRNISILSKLYLGEDL